MAFPEDTSIIDTNLSPEELGKVIEAIENKEVEWGESKSPFTAGAFGDSATLRSGIFIYNGQEFELEEWNEWVTKIKKI